MTTPTRRWGRLKQLGRREPRLGQVVADAARAGRHHWRRVIGAGIVVFGVSALAETLIDSGVVGRATEVAVPVGLLALGADVLGEVFFAGLLERLVGEASHDAPSESTWTIVRTLPYRRLIVADVLVVIVVVVGFAAFIVPGVVLFTLLCLTGPIVNIEGASPVGALRRSVHLVRRRFWSTLALVTVPFLVADSIATSVQNTLHAVPIAGDFCIRLALMMAVAIATSLVQVELAYRLIELEAEQRL